MTVARDDTPRSASGMLQDQQDPAVRLAESIDRYLDALHLAAEHAVGQSAAQALERFANRLVPGLTDESAWPTLRARLLLLAADGADPHEHLRKACEASEMHSADDQAAVLDWRLDSASTRSSPDGPLPWLPGIPDRIAADLTWGPYLGARSRLITQLADRVRLTAKGEDWADQLHAPLPAELIADVQVWRAATQVDPSDLRLTGPPQLGHAARIFQQQLDKRLAAAATDEDRRWRQLLAAEAPAATADSFLPQLTERLSNLTRAGFDVSRLVRSAAAEGPLPDDHPAAALWWRILDQLAPQPNTVRTSRRTTATARGRQSPAPRSAPPPAVGPSR
jgi:hypothetical protein